MDVNDICRIVEVSNSMLDYEGAIEELKAKDTKLKRVRLPDYFSSIHQSHNVIYSKSLEYYFKRELEESEKVSLNFKGFVSAGEAGLIQFKNEIALHSERIMHFQIILKKKR